MTNSLSSAVSLFGLWAALVLIGFSAISVIRNMQRRDSDGLVTADPITAFVILIVSPIVAGSVILVTSGNMLIEGADTYGDAGGWTEPAPTPAQHLADSSVLTLLVVGVVLLWLYALLSTLVATVIRYRQQRRLRQQEATAQPAAPSQPARACGAPQQRTGS